MKHIMHMSPEERLANSSQEVLSATQQQTAQVQEMTRAIQKMGDSSKDDNIVRKLEEVKSASLITNRLLKDISKKELQPSELIRVIKGDPGKNYVLTVKDKKEIADSITVPVITKIIEKVETIKEQPIVNNIVTEVAMKDEPDELIGKINSSKKIIDAERVRGLVKLIRTYEKQGEGAGSGYSTGGANPLIFQNSSGTRISDYITTIKLSTGLSGSASGGVLTITGSASTGFQVPTSGAVGTGNQTFVFTTAPNVICIDGGRFMQQISSDGTVNWTGTTTVILTIAPNFDIFSPA